MRASEVIADIYPGGDKLRSARVGLLVVPLKNLFAGPRHAAVRSTGAHRPTLSELDVTASPRFEQQAAVRGRVVMLIIEASPHRQWQADAPEGERVPGGERNGDGDVRAQLVHVVVRIAAVVLRARINPERQAAIHKVLVSKRHPKRGVNFLIPVGCNALQIPAGGIAPVHLEKGHRSNKRNARDPPPRGGYIPRCGRRHLLRIRRTRGNTHPVGADLQKAYPVCRALF
uniref:Uncharacterized protein n=1 Tax=Treponema paraluiscuniculi TaxID=53435 RepID=A8QVX0_9SPIR|nr:truncated hypothetical protein [Treponema paraluiscuniculi]